MSYRPTIVAGPSGVGKGTVIARLMASYPEVWLSISVTTRPPRAGECDGREYHFVTEAEFDDLIAHDGLLEWAEYPPRARRTTPARRAHGAVLYGTPRGPVEAIMADERPVLLELDVQGARAVKASLPQVQSVFLAPPSWAELVRRLTARGTESAEVRQRRLDAAQRELACQTEFDRVIVNREVEETVQELVDFIGLGAL